MIIISLSVHSTFLPHIPIYNVIRIFNLIYMYIWVLLLCVCVKARVFPHLKRLHACAFVCVRAQEQHWWWRARICDAYRTLRTHHSLPQTLHNRAASSSTSQVRTSTGENIHTPIDDILKLITRLLLIVIWRGGGDADERAPPPPHYTAQSVKAHLKTIYVVYIVKVEYYYTTHSENIQNTLTRNENSVKTM